MYEKKRLYITESAGKQSPEVKPCEVAIGELLA
jgi:hypothetical protein